MGVTSVAHLSTYSSVLVVSLLRNSKSLFGKANNNNKIMWIVGSTGDGFMFTKC